VKRSRTSSSPLVFEEDPPASFFETSLSPFHGGFLRDFSPPRRLKSSRVKVPFPRFRGRTIAVCCHMSRNLNFYPFSSQTFPPGPTSFFLRVLTMPGVLLSAFFFFSLSPLPPPVRYVFLPRMRHPPPFPVSNSRVRFPRLLFDKFPGVVRLASFPGIDFVLATRTLMFRIGQLAWSNRTLSWFMVISPESLYDFLSANGIRHAVGAHPAVGLTTPQRRSAFPFFF